MIPFTSCLRFSQQRQHRWLVVQTQLTSEVQLENLPGNNVDIKFSDAKDELEVPPSDEISQKNVIELNHADAALIEASFGLGKTRKKIDKFLTLQRKRKLTRAHSQSLSLPAHLSILLDDVANKQTQYVLERISNWKFNAFTLDITTGGRPLPVLLLHFMDLYGLIDYFHLEPVKVWKCFSMIESGYHSNNPYHNAIHATDVTQAMHCFLQEPKIFKYLTPLEKMSALIAAVTHDLDHPGVNQPFLVATSNHLAALYKNASILENHHWRSAVSCMLNSNAFSELDHKDWESMVNQIQALILCTDITRHQEFLTTFRNYIIEENMNLEDCNCRLFILQIAMKCADISNPCRPWEVCKKWSAKVCEEFFRQGDYERDLKLPVTTMCDRTKTPASKIQIGFIKYIVAMLFDLWDQFHRTSLSNELVKNMRWNLEQWEQIYGQEEGAVLSDDSSSMNAGDDETTTSETKEGKDGDGRRASLDSDISATISKGRRYTLPLILPQYLPITRLRRESLGGDGATVVLDEDSITCPDSPDKQALQHQPASFPPYFRLTRQVNISPKTKPRMTTCRAEASLEPHNNRSHGSDTSSSSPGCSDRLCRCCSSPPPSSSSQPVQSPSGDGSQPPQCEHDDNDGGPVEEEQSSGNHHGIGLSLVDVVVAPDDNGMCKGRILLPNSRPPNNFYRRGSEPVDIKKFRLFEIPCIELQPSFRSNNANKQTFPRRGSMPATLIEIRSPLDDSLEKKPSISLRYSLGRRSSFPREYKAISGHLVDHLAHISSSESETETASGVTNVSACVEYEPHLKTEVSLPRGSVVRRSSAPIIGATVRVKERLYAVYTTADESNNDFGDHPWKTSHREKPSSSTSLEYLYHRQQQQQQQVLDDCRTMSGIISGLWHSRAYLDQRTNGSSVRSESSFHLHSNVYEQNNSGIDVCYSQFLLSRGRRRASAPVTISSSYVA